MRSKIFAFFVIISFLLSGCTLKKDKPLVLENPIDPGQEQNQIINDGNQLKTDDAQINKFTDEEELRDFLENNAYNSGGSGMYMEKRMQFNGDFMGEAMPEAAYPGLSSVDYAGGGSDDFSKTNVQVEGVDEADIIKTDGEYVYAVVKNNLFIIKAYPTENAEVLSKIEFKSRPDDMYLADNRLVIFGADNVFERNESAKIWPGRNQFAFFKIFDISDRKNPVQLKNLNFEGNYRDSRMIGDYVYFVTENYSYGIMDDNQPILPLILDGGEAVNYVCPSNPGCVWPDVYYFDLPYHSYKWTAVNTINVKNPEAGVGGDIYLMDNNQNMYVSLNNIYITYTKYTDESKLIMEVSREIVYPRLSASDRDRFLKIEAVDNFILDKNEKLEKIFQIIERYSRSLVEEERTALETETIEAIKRKYEDLSKELEKTVIHKIGIDKEKIEYKASGEVTGKILNQFSMDENNGYFRIATTKSPSWSLLYIVDEDDEKARLSYSNLYILDENLKPVGAVEELAPDERIYSVRFMQNRAYMVTFKQVDPLFVIDLSNPANPRVLGELKIPGFSNYLHPYDENYLIGLGKDAKENEWGGVATLGIKLSLFDVRDVANPKEIDNYILGDAGSDSIALNDHKAFLFDKEKNLLVIPASINEYANTIDSSPLIRRRSSLRFSGAVVFKIDESGFELKGKIDHSDGGRASQTDYWQGISYYDNSVKRALYISDTLYTFSNNYLKMNNLSDLVETNMLRLEKKDDGEDDYKVIN